MKRTTISLDEVLFQRLANDAAFEKRSLSAQVASILKQWYQPTKNPFRAGAERFEFTFEALWDGSTWWFSLIKDTELDMPDVQESWTFEDLDAESIENPYHLLDMDQVDHTLKTEVAKLKNIPSQQIDIDFNFV